MNYSQTMQRILRETDGELYMSELVSYMTDIGVINDL